MGFSGVRLHGSNPVPLMSTLGHKQTSQGISRMSALPPKADIRSLYPHVRFVPKADIRSDFEVEDIAASSACPVEIWFIRGLSGNLGAAERKTRARQINVSFTPFVPIADIRTALCLLCRFGGPASYQVGRPSFRTWDPPSRVARRRDSYMLKNPPQTPARKRVMTMIIATCIMPWSATA